MAGQCLVMAMLSAIFSKLDMYRVDVVLCVMTLAISRPINMGLGATHTQHLC